ncbi:MAG: M17 family peptidase N-terminal domain-containing protein, partial [Betaproteobacteria bacterium]
MEFSIKAVAPEKLKCDCVAVAIFAASKLSTAAQALDRASKGRISAILKQGDFSAKPGSSLMLYDLAGVASKRVLLVGFVATDAEREFNRTRLRAIGERILREVPGSAWASDQQYREADIAIDFREDVPPLPQSAIDRIVALMRAEGMSAKVSSIHVNGWFGDYNKLGMTTTLMHEVFAIDLDADRE